MKKLFRVVREIQYSYYVYADSKEEAENIYVSAHDLFDSDIDYTTAREEIKIGMVDDSWKDCVPFQNCDDDETDDLTIEKYFEKLEEEKQNEVAVDPNQMTLFYIDHPPVYPRSDKA